MELPYACHAKDAASARHRQQQASSIMCCLIGIVVMMASTIDVARAEDLMELTCTDTAQCQHYQHATTMNATCRDGHCQCMDEHGVRIACEPKVQNKNNIIGGPCPCGQPHTRCNEDEQICYCDEDYVATADRRRCMPKQVPLEGQCETDQQCQAAGNYPTFCNPVRHTCECLTGFITGANDNKCRATIGTGLNASCSDDKHCALFGANVECLEIKQCICKEGFVVPANASSCVQALGYGHNCSSDLQCQYSLGLGGRCSQHGLCACGDKYVPLTTGGNETNRIVQCYRVKELGQYCWNDTDCHQTHFIAGEPQTMRCVYGECNCIEGFHIDKNAQCTSGVSDVGFHTKRNIVGALCMSLVGLLSAQRRT